MIIGIIGKQERLVLFPHFTCQLVISCNLPQSIRKYTDVNDDNIPDIPIGRFVVKNTTELNNMIAKTLLYQTKIILIRVYLQQIGTIQMKVTRSIRHLTFNLVQHTSLP